MILKQERSRVKGNNKNRREEKDKATTGVICEGETVIIYENDYVNAISQEYEYVIARIICSP